MGEVRKSVHEPGPAEQLEIDRRYGLEPVYEPGSDPRMVSLQTSTEIRCPWCGERYETQVDITAGHKQRMVEDCQVCCQPIDLDLDIDPRSARIQLHARRPDA